MCSNDLVINSFSVTVLVLLMFDPGVFLSFRTSGVLLRESSNFDFKEFAIRFWVEDEIPILFSFRWSYTLGF